MAITFDPANKRIILDSASVTASEIWSRWADWVAGSDNAKYLPACSQVGGDDLGGGLSIPIYIFLLNGWRVRPMEANHTLIITGNLFVQGGGVPVVPTLGTFNVSTQYTVPVQAQGIATSGSVGPSAGVIASAVWSTVIDGLSAEEITRILFAALAGKRQGIGTATEQYFGNDGITPRITFSPDANGNGTPVLDGSV